MVLKELTNEEFTQYAKNFPNHSVFQTAEYAFIMNKQNFDSFYLGLVDSNNVVHCASLILVAVSRGVKYAYSPRGFLIDYMDYNLINEFTENVKRFLRRNDIAAIKINPLIVRYIYDAKGNIIQNNENNVNIICNTLTDLEYHHLGYNNYFEAFKPRFEAVVDLNRPYHEIFNGFKKTLRTKIRKADRYGCHIYKGNINNLEYLYELTKNVYPRDLRYFQDCYEFFGKKDMIEFYYAKLDTKVYLQQVQKQYERQEQYVQYINNEIIKKPKNNNHLLSIKMTADKTLALFKKQIISATHLLRNNPDGIVLAAALIIKHQDELIVLMDGFNKNLKSIGAKQLLLWKVMQKYAGSEYKSINLGGIPNPNIKVNNKYQGVLDFKMAFNPQVKEYIGDFELVTSKTLYFMYNNALVKGLFG